MQRTAKRIHLFGWFICKYSEQVLSRKYLQHFTSACWLIGCFLGMREHKLHIHALEFAYREAGAGTLTDELE